MTKNNLNKIIKLIKIAENAYLEKSYQKSIDNYIKAINIYSEVLEVEDEYLAKLYNNLADSYLALGIYDKANEYYQLSIIILQKTSKENPTNLAISLNNLAMVHTEQGKYENAEVLHEQALEIRLNYLGKNHPDTAQSYNNLAGLFKKLGNYEKAENYYYKSLDIQRKSLGEDHPDTAITYNNIADLFQTLGRYDDALTNYEKSKNILLKTLKENHPKTQLVERNIVLLKDSVLLKTSVSADYEGILARIEKKLELLENIENPQISSRSIPKGLINLPREKNEYFIEQSNIFARIDAKLAEHHLAYLHGTHGLGKTTTLNEYARARVENYDFIFYVLATDGAIETEMARLADEFLETVAAEDTPAQKAAKLKVYLEENERWKQADKNWLIIFDNLESAARISQYFPRTAKGDCLYACNEKLFVGNDREVYFEQFSPEEAERFVFQKLNDTSEAKQADIPAENLAEIKKLIDRLGRLPLSLNIAAVYFSLYLQFLIMF